MSATDRHEPTAVTSSGAELAPSSSGSAGVSPKSPRSCASSTGTLAVPAPPALRAGGTPRSHRANSTSGLLSLGRLQRTRSAVSIGPSARFLAESCARSTLSWAGAILSPGGSSTTGSSTVNRTTAPLHPCALAPASDEVAIPDSAPVWGSLRI